MPRQITRWSANLVPQTTVRADKYISEHHKLMTRSQLKNRLVYIKINGRPAKLSTALNPGDHIELCYEEETEIRLEGENIVLDVLYEDDAVITVNKPQGMVVHPAKGHRTGTLVQALLYRCGILPGGDHSSGVRPGIVHRLDKDTSGVIIAAKTPDALDYLAKQFKDRSTEKRYTALVKGEIRPAAGEITSFLGRDPRHRKRFAEVERGGKESVTRYRTLRRFNGYTLLQLSPKTGRTHQLRVHLSSRGNPILGDPVYARKDPAFPEAGLMLHSYYLRIGVPGGITKIFRAPLPEHFRSIIGKLKQQR
ncbi:MAG: RluA family pseudouridine synthase [Spirochaetia bacterium]